MNRRGALAADPCTHHIYPMMIGDTNQLLPSGLLEWPWPSDASNLGIDQSKHTHMLHVWHIYNFTP